MTFIKRHWFFCLLLGLFLFMVWNALSMPLKITRAAVLAIGLGISVLGWLGAIPWALAAIAGFYVSAFGLALGGKAILPPAFYDWIPRRAGTTDLSVHTP